MKRTPSTFYREKRFVNHSNITEPTFIAKTPVLRNDGSHSLASNSTGAAGTINPSPSPAPIPSAPPSQSESEGGEESEEDPSVAAELVAGLDDRARRAAAFDNVTRGHAAEAVGGPATANAPRAAAAESPLLP